MVCQACGGPVGPEVRFCTQCGAQVIAVPWAPQQYAAVPYAAPMPLPRVTRHVQTLGMLWCVFALWRVVEGVIGIFFVKVLVFRRWHGGWPSMSGPMTFMPPWMHLMPIIAGVALLAAMFAGFVGWSLLTRRTWGRWLAIVAAMLVLFKLPFGTALGIYTLWVLAPTTSGYEYDSLAEPG